MAASRSKSVLVFLAVSLAIGLPLLFYVVAKVLGKDKLPMPPYYLADQTIPARNALKLIEAGQLKPASELIATNQFGDQVSLNKDLKGKMLAINFFFTTCTATCPKLTNHMKQLEYAFRATPMSKNDTTVQFISISVDPEHDSANLLRAYAKQHKVDENHWWFLTGNKKMLYQWARQFKISVAAGDGGADDFIHTNVIIVLDKDRFVRGYYDGLNDTAIGTCANDMGLLTMEKCH